MLRDPYQAYVLNGVMGSNPLQLVITMYETAIARTQQARECLEAGDTWGRAMAISKAGAILSQLIVSLDPTVGANIGINLDRLYHYMQRRLQDAHLKKVVAPLLEVENLLKNLLEAWRKVAEAERHTTPVSVERTEARIESMSPSYSTYGLETNAWEGVAVSA